MNVYPTNQKINLRINSTGPFPLQKIDIFINENYLGTTKYPFDFSFIPSELDNLKTENEIKLIAYDSAYNQSEITSVFNTQ